MDTHWLHLQPLLPPEKPWTGRPNVDHRRILNGILWVHRTGAPWRDLPLHYGPVGTMSSRLYRWRAAGVWDQVLLALQSEADAQGEVDWDLHFVDATVIRAHQHAAGARRDGAVGDGENVEALGRSQGGFSTKLHLRAEGGGKPIVAVLTGGERHKQRDYLIGSGGPCSCSPRRRRPPPVPRPRSFGQPALGAGRSGHCAPRSADRLQTSHPPPSGSRCCG